MQERLTSAGEGGEAVRSPGIEVSHALTTCRRLLESVADHVFPPQGTPYRLGEESLDVGPQKTLNPLRGVPARVRTR